MKIQLLVSKGLLQLFLVLIFLCIESLLCQESLRNINTKAENKGQHSFHKYLTLHQTDTWVLAGKKGDVWMIKVSTNMFDPILELCSPDGSILASVDEEGSLSRLSIILTQDGSYKILVKSFQNQGEGRYDLDVQTFPATEIIPGKAIWATFPESENFCYYWTAQAGETFLPEIKGSAIRQWTIKNNLTEDISTRWYNSITLEKKGIYYLILMGKKDEKYGIELHQAKFQALESNPDGSLTANTIGTPYLINVYKFSAKINDIRIIQIEKKGEVYGQLSKVILEDEKEKELNQPFWKNFPILEKGCYIRWAVQFQQEGTYQVKILSRSETEYTLKIWDPVYNIAIPHSLNGQISIGGSQFYRFPVSAGELVDIQLSSSNFDPYLRLYHPTGNIFTENDDSEDIQSRIISMLQQPGQYLIQISSVGNGGSGNYELKLKTQEIPYLKTPQQYHHQITRGNYGYWYLEGKAGTTIVILVRSKDFTPAFEIYSPNGIFLHKVYTGYDKSNCIWTATLKETGRYTIAVRPESGQGNYTIQTWIVD